MGVGAAIGLQAVGSLTSAYGQYTQGLAQANYFKYLASNSRTEAALATREGELQSTLVQNQGLKESEIATRHEKEVVGTQTAAAGANVGGGSVTSADIATDTFNKAKLDQLAIKYNADIESWNATQGAKLKAWQLNREAGGYDISGEAARAGGKMGAFNSLLSGAGQVANTWYSNSPYKNSQVPKYATTFGKRVPVAPSDYYNGGG